MDWQGWISKAYTKSEASWKKNYAACMVWSLWYYSFCIFKQQSDIQCRLMLSKAATCAWKSMKMPCPPQLGKYCASSTITQGQIQQESCKKKYWIKAGLFHPIHYIYQTLHQVIFSFTTKCSEWQKIFSRGSGKNVCGKPAEFYLRGINNISDKWLEVIQNNGKYTIDWN